MGFEHEWKYIAGEEIPHADALRRMNFDEDDSKNDRVQSVTSISLRETWRLKQKPKLKLEQIDSSRK